MRKPWDLIARNARNNRWEGAFESLEPRVLLSGFQNGAWEIGQLQWHGANVEVVEGSWLLTFDSRQSAEQATARATQVAAALGIAPTQIDSLGRGRWARVVTDGQVTEAAVAAVVNQFNFLSHVEPEKVYRQALAPNDAEFGLQWPHLNTGQNIPGSGPGLVGSDISSTTAWDRQTGSRQVIIAVLDTGVDLFHPDLMANIWTNPGEIPGNGVDDDGNGFIDDVNGYDFGGMNDNNPQDPMTQGHGTAVAGVIGAVGNNGIGVAGVAWQVSILPVKIFPDTGLAGGGDVIEAIDYCTMMITDFGHNIVASNNSYGSVNPDTFDFFNAAEELAVQEFTDAGAIFVAAAGNDTIDNDGNQSAFPASYDNPFIISVAATDNQDRLADFSNWGLTSVDIGAPGVRTRTTSTGGGYEYIDGTSFASPYTAGVIALLASASPFATQAQLRDAIYNGVDPVESLAGLTVTGGRLNADASLRLVGFPGPLVVSIFPGPVSGQVNQISVGFDEAIDPAFFDVTDGIVLRRANGNGLFDGNDIFVSIPEQNVSLEGPVLRINFPGSSLPVDRYRLTLNHMFFRDLDGNFLNGTTVMGNDEVYEFRIVAGGGPLEPNDSIAQATPLILDGNGAAGFTNLAIGDGASPSMDVDIFRLTLPGPGLITAQIAARSLPIPSTLDSVLRLFDSSGRELARNDNFNGLDSRVQFFVPAGGRYFVGVSGFGNTGYNPAQIATGMAGASSGTYDISFVVDSAASEEITYPSTGGAQGIPSQGTIVSTIFVPDVRAVQDLNVRVNILHTYVGDLRITLRSPSGTLVPLSLNRGGSGDNFNNTTFDDGAAISILAGSPPFAGTFRPEGSLADFNQESAEGLWTLTIQDTTALNSGTLLGWAMDMTLDNAISGPFEFNDTIATSTDTLINGTGSAGFEARIGDGAYGRRDVDFFRFTADAGTTVTATVTVLATGPNAAPNLLDSVLRLFDSQGNELLLDARVDSANSSVSFPVQFAGTYYLGVSGGSNQAYLPIVGGSGQSSEATGDYTLGLQIVGGITDQPVVLTGNNLQVGVSQDGSLGVDSTGLTRDGIEFITSSDGEVMAESFYGATFNGFIFRNAGPGVQSDLPVSLANQSDFSNQRLVVEGLFRASVPQPDRTGGLLVRRALSFGLDDRFVVVDVALTNTTFLTMDRVGWVEGFRPTQAVNLESEFSRTVNNVDNATGRLVTSSYTNGDFPGGVTFGLGAALPAGDIEAYASVEQPNSVRDAFQVVDSPVDPDASDDDSGVEADGLLTLGYDVGVIAPGATVTLRYFIFTGTSAAEVQTQFSTLESGTGTDHLVADPLNPSIEAADLPYALYYPEGFANDRASTFLPLSNPHHVPSRVVVIARYEDPNLAPDVLFDGNVGAASRDGITITTPELFAADQQMVQKNSPFALEIRSSLPIGATLSHFDFGISTGQAFTSEPSTTWTFSEGFKGQNVSDFLVFYNTSDQPIKVTLTVYPETGNQAIPQLTQEIGAHRRGGWDLGATSFIPNGPFGMRLEAEAPIVAALTHFDMNLGGGFAVLGLPSIGVSSGVSPEGQLGLNSETEFVTVLNAGSQPSEVTFTFMFANQSAFRQRLLVQPGRRSGFSVGELPGFPQLTQPYSISYEATQPVSVTLSSFAFGAGAATRFTDEAFSYWLFSEGFRPGQGSAVTEYLRLFSSSTQEITVEISLDFAPAPEFGDMGGTETFRRVLTPRAANDFDIHDFITGERATRDTFYSVTVKAPMPITAYAGRYDSFLNGGLGTLGTPLGNIMSSI